MTPTTPPTGPPTGPSATTTPTAPPTATAPAMEPGTVRDSREPAAPREVAGRRWRRSRGVLLVVLVILGLAFVLTAVRPTVQPQFLDPESPSQVGTRALVELLRQRGTSVKVARDAEDAAGQAAAGSDVLLVVTRPERLTPAEVDRLGTVPGADLLVIDPTRDALLGLAPGIVAAARNVTEQRTEPGCDLTAATLAGTVDLAGSMTFETPDTASRCYPVDGLPQLVRYRPAGRTVTVLGGGRFLTNSELAYQGHAALGLNLIGDHSTVVWLIPDLPEPGSAGGDRSPMDLVPFGVKLALLQLLIAVVLAALWRSRRLGPVVAEPLPVAVRSAEAVEGRARLYRARRATGSAAEALRAGTRERLVSLLGLPLTAAQDPAMAPEIVSATAARTRLDPATVGAALYGPAPVDDAELVRLTDFLDDLERQVRQS